MTFLARLVERAEAQPDRPLLRYRSGGRVVDVGAAELLDEARRWAAAIRDAGAAPGDRVAVLLASSRDFVTFWFALPMAGVVEVPVNAEQRGLALRHVVEDSAPSVVIVDLSLRPHLDACGYAGDAEIVVWDDEARIRFSATRPVDVVDPGPRPLACVMYTSGTTGPSKGVMLSHGYFGSLGRNLVSMLPDAGADEVFYLCSPMFHVDARCVMSAALETGGCVAFAPRFSARGFWGDVREFDATFFLFIGAMLAILAKTSSPAELAGHRLRAATGAPIPLEAYEFFESTVDIALIEVYGLTEAAAITWSTPGRKRRGSAGWPAGPFEVRVVDAEDRPLPAGTTGEIAFRPKGPDLMTMGYWQRDEATVAATRNLWFHTGDLGRFDDDGFLWFVGRDKDMIRRRGENISAYEVEATVSQLAGVLECAAVPTADEVGGEEEILLYVVPVPGADLDARAVAEFARGNLARFAQPRWIHVIDDVPHTPTGKVAKHLLDRFPGAGAVDCHELAEAAP